MPVSGCCIDARGVLVDEAGGLLVSDQARAWLLRLQSTGTPVLALFDGEDPAPDLGDLPLAAVLTAEADEAWPKPIRLLRAATAYAFDPFSSWLITARHEPLQATGSAGFIGAVLLGDGPDPSPTPACTLARARDLADAPRVMVPPSGGCWHDHR
jgi:hypothetical protein